ncbi:MAG: hypothetical protein K2G30_06060 [Muribaculaceae bacterium]|nr:hypothetical protein [Muribaculaceae bacterium]
MGHKVYSRVPAWLFSALVVAAILWLTLAREPLPETSLPLIPGFDKIGHVCMFGGLYFALAFDWRLHRRMRGKEKSRRGLALGAVLLAGLCVAFGGLIELLQEWMGQGRGADWLDFAADAAGVLFSVVVTPWVLRRIGLGARPL